MNHSKTFKIFTILMLFIFLLPVSILKAQTSSSKNDSIKIEILNHVTIKNCNLPIWDSLILIDDSASFNTFVKSAECRDFDRPKVDFSKYSIIALYTFADCAASFNVEAVKYEQQKMIHFIIKNFYGGCAGMSTFANFITIDKIPADYRISKDVIRVN